MSDHQKHAKTHANHTYNEASFRTCEETSRQSLPCMSEQAQGLQASASPEIESIRKASRHVVVAPSTSHADESAHDSPSGGRGLSQVSKEELAAEVITFGQKHQGRRFCRHGKIRSGWRSWCLATATAPRTVTADSSGSWSSKWITSSKLRCQ